MNRTSSKSTSPSITGLRIGRSENRKDSLGQRQRNPPFDAGRPVQDGSGERQHAVRDLVVDDGPLESRVAPQVQPGRIVLVSNQLGLEMKDAAIEAGLDGIDREPPIRRPQHHRDLA